MDRRRRKMDRMRKNKVASKQGGKDIIATFDIIIKKQGGGEVAGPWGFSRYSGDPPHWFDALLM